MLDREDLPALVNERALHVVWPYLVVMVRDLTSQMGMPPVGVPTPYEFDYMLRQAGWFARPPGRARQPGAGSAIPLCVARSWPSNCSKPPSSGVSPSPISPQARRRGRGRSAARRPSSPRAVGSHLPRTCGWACSDSGKGFAVYRGIRRLDFFASATAVGDGPGTVSVWSNPGETWRGVARNRQARGGGFDSPWIGHTLGAAARSRPCGSLETLLNSADPRGSTGYGLSAE